MESSFRRRMQCYSFSLSPSLSLFSLPALTPLLMSCSDTLCHVLLSEKINVEEQSERWNSASRRDATRLVRVFARAFICGRSTARLSRDSCLTVVCNYFDNWKRRWWEAVDELIKNFSLHWLHTANGNMESGRGCCPLLNAAPLTSPAVMTNAPRFS